MKHVIVGVIVAAAVVITFTVWALLGELVGPEWALAVMAVAAGLGALAGVVDFATEKGEQG
mgnify:CR=1 FL=1